MQGLLAKAMKDKGVTGQQLSRMSGVSECTISAAKSGRGNLATTVKLFDALGLKLVYTSK